MNTIIELQTELEELEKRIKAISSAQSSLSQLMAISEYFEQVQTYLSDLNTLYNNHIIECEDYATRISSLEEQMTVLSEKVDNISTSENVDLTQMQTDITTLTQSLDNLKNGSTTTIADIDLQISSLQTDHQNMQDDIDQNTTDISTINQTISNLQSEITNLTTTQNNLSNTQSNLTATVGSINSRLTTAEANISTLTGGVDVSEIDQRLSELELYSGPCYYYTKQENIETPLTNELKYIPIYFSCAPHIPIFVHGTITYEVDNTSSTTVLQLYLSGHTVVLASSNPATDNGKCDFFATLYTSYQSNLLMLKVNNPNGLKLTGYEIYVHGANVRDIEYDPEITAYCFDNNIYITRRYEDHIKYGKYTSSDSITINNLTNQQSLVVDGVGHQKMLFLPFVSSQTDTDGTSYLSECKDVLLGLKFDGYLNGINTADSTALEDVASASCEIFANPAVCYNGFTVCFYLQSGRPGYRYCYNDRTYKLGDSDLGKNFTRIWPVLNNNRTIGDAIITYNKIPYLCKKSDGYIYLMRGITASFASCKICKGDSANGYMQPDGSINIYIKQKGNILKYKAYITETDDNISIECSLNSTITSCLCIMELIDNLVLKKNNLGTWSVTTLEY